MQQKLWYYAIYGSWLKEWQLWEILTEAKKYPPIFRLRGQGYRIISDSVNEILLARQVPAPGSVTNKVVQNSQDRPVIIVG